jgi:o-succinylbenzoate synthase
MKISVNTKLHSLDFKSPAGTSRGVMHRHHLLFVLISTPEHPSLVGIGECAPLPGLSKEYHNNYFEECIKMISTWTDTDEIDWQWLSDKPSLFFAFETALADLKQGATGLLYPSAFTEGKASIAINGLIWMNSKEHMLNQIKDKLAKGFRVIKLKIGAIDFQEELELLQFIRSRYAADELEIRVDANGAFSAEEASDKLKALSVYHIHSIEQPIKAGQWAAMNALCREAMLPIALDEELIGMHDSSQKRDLLREIMPPYIILKPTLHGGLKGCEEWIALADELGISWWITSALESNIGLNVIAQWAYSLAPHTVHGLGTGQLYVKNIPSALSMETAELAFDPNFVRPDLKLLFS